ncbi:hypothetical protein CARUB_v10003449mg [Capsella rubella]|uniref:PGG domain-containing protein n=1 Tax=Capsella rubella TaxID=81985 RepID=R0FC85_9BRAS|nr:hypothetical protein CARUB_v10003449mg [Capsella rubella]
MDSSEVDRIEAQGSLPDFYTNIRLSDLFNIPGEYVPMCPQIHSAVSAGKKEWVEKLKSYGKPMACLKSEQGDSVLHVAAVWGRLELVKSIVSECPCLLLELDSRDQLPLHVAARAGHVDVVNALVATLTSVLAKSSEEEKQNLNLYVAKDINGDTPLHLALKSPRVKTVGRLVDAYQQASFHANKDGISPLHLAVEAGKVIVVTAMSKTTDNNKQDSQLEGRKCLVHAALKAKNTVSIGFYEGVCNLLDRSTKSVYVCNDDGSFPIHIAAEKFHPRVLREILKRCPDSKYLLNKHGQNIFHIAAMSGRAAGFLYLHFRRFNRDLMEKQDVDGNTPLHLATLKWRPRSLFLLLFLNQGKWIHMRNNCGLTALDIAESNLQPNYIFIERVTLVVLLYFNRKSITKPSDPPAGDKVKDYINTLLVVAALVATVTFAAGFTIPGGFNSSGPKLGSATLANDRKLVYFMVFDILAMQSSILTIATLIWAQLGDPALVQKSLNVALPSLFFALLCMPVAFYCGVFVAFSHVKGLMIFLDITSVVFVFTMLFILGPHVLLQIPGLPGGIFGLYFMQFLYFFNEDSYKKAPAPKISGRNHLIQEKESS